uniref:SERRATE/Ars2 C-terminal domain-containing protein n=1 Tax=Branchiostoma floridae TaxID=7739 RepID=C3ZTZ3_BRAFL|eukprot:XP_002587868.1 hypothetical protein BRAFLDRAFT_124875 [Branchiostoma floridae]
MMSTIGGEVATSSAESGAITTYAGTGRQTQGRLERQMCKRFPGFLRVALSEPAPDRKFYRRGWITFDRSVNIKEICWNLQNIRLRDCELSPVVNRDLARRIRPVSGIVIHKQILRNDLRLAAKLVMILDARSKLWEDQGGEKGDPEKEVLDRLLLYLRIVHSIDYYTATEYPNEDEMPNRCGIMHGRGPVPTGRPVTQKDVDEWLSTFEQKVSPLLAVKDNISEEEAIKLGKKDPEKFVKANTQEISKDKWLCPISGKKFKGPEFVRKHIFNKHADKVESVKKECVFFNNYILEPKRPQLPEPQTTKPPPLMGPGGGRGEGYGMSPMYQGPPGGFMYGQPRPPMYEGPGFMPPYGRGGFDGYGRGGGGYGHKPRGRSDPETFDLHSSDLETFDLHSSDLGTFDLHSSDLETFDLHSSDLETFDLHSSDLGTFDLHSSDLETFDLHSSDLETFDLHSSDLGTFDLHSSDFWTLTSELLS